MIKRIFKRLSRQKIILPVTILIFLASTSLARQTDSIVLHNELLDVNQKQFYIDAVADGREDRNSIGRIITNPTAKDSDPVGSAIDLAGGFTAIKQFITRGLPSNKSLRPVIITLQKFNVSERLLPDKHVEGHVNLQLSFDLKNTDTGPIHLTDYKGNAVYKRATRPAQAVEPILRQALKNGLIYFLNWIDAQSATNIKLATNVKLILTDYADTTEGDTIYYAVKRPITWADFQSKIAASRYSAEVFPGIGYDEHTEIKNSIVNVHLSIKVFLPKSACWVKDGDRTDYALNHEQRHFDIVKIVAEHLKQKLKAENLPVNNFDGFINVDYLDAYREMNDLQKQYDDETHHGVETAEQQRWNERIDKELKAYGVK